MPFGAHRAADGQTHFRFWAPSARSVQLQLEGPDATKRRVRMDENDGWYEAWIDGLSAGERYRYWIDDELAVPDPAARFNPDGVTGPSEIIDPATFEWEDNQWAGRPWKDAVIYELHVGTFTPEGSYEAAAKRLPDLAAIGITAIELLPVAEFPGTRGWGYDGVLHFAPHYSYGTPDDLKRFVQAAHAANLMVFLDVVYNHFGPEGNYLPRYAKPFFTDRYETPWGAAINFDGEGSSVAREFFIHNALYWLEEFHFDGLRLDAVHAMYDESATHFVDELARRVHEGPGRERPVHLILENHSNHARRLLRGAHGEVQLSTAQWNDDIHHAFHVLMTNETDGYYVDYAEEPEKLLGRALAEGFIYQGEASKHAGGKHRGEVSKELPTTAFINFLQNHDQVGNRAFGDRIAALCNREALSAGLTTLLLAPHIPMLFMGEEYAAAQPFLYFCDYQGDLAQAVTNGRRNEFAGFKAFEDEQARLRIPDPNDPKTQQQSILQWADRAREPHAAVLKLVTQLLELRARIIVPLIDHLQPGGGHYRVLGDRSFVAYWIIANSPCLTVEANFSEESVNMTPLAGTEILTELIYSSTGSSGHLRTKLAPWEVRWMRTMDSSGS